MLVSKLTFFTLGDVFCSFLFVSNRLIAID